MGGSEISSKIFTRKSSAETIRDDLQVNDVMIFDKSPRVEIMGKFRKGDEVQVYK